MSLLVLTNESSSLNFKPADKVTLKIGLTPAGVQGIPGDFGVVTNVVGQSTTESVSQKLFTDNLFEANQKLMLANLTEATDILNFINKLDGALT